MMSTSLYSIRGEASQPADVAVETDRGHRLDGCAFEPELVVGLGADRPDA